MQQTTARRPAACRGAALAPVAPRPARPSRRSGHGRGLAPRAVIEPKTAVTEPRPPALESGDYPEYARPSTRAGKPRVVCIGSGWGVCSFIKALPAHVAERVDLTVVSPRNYFLYTPLLPAVATGTVEERSIVEPVRKVLGGKGAYFEAVCHEIDPASKSIVCCFPADAGLDQACFKIEYDILILGVGTVNNTFGVEGVEEHAFFFKSIEDASRLRRHVSECFERAALPQTPPEEKERLLSFVVCGGGPTGVEVAAELHDMITEDLAKIYPDIIQFARVRIIELSDHLLSTYDREISKYTDAQFRRAGIDTILNTRVKAVRGEGRGKGAVVVEDANGVVSEVPFSACVWATGIARHPLVTQLQARLPRGAQTHFRSVVTTPTLEVVGSGGTIFALGDAATIGTGTALAAAADLFEEADANGDGFLDLGEVRALLRSASARYPHFEEHARFLDDKYGGPARWGGLVSRALAAARTAREAEGRSKAPGKASAADGTVTIDDLDDDTRLTRPEFEALLGSIDRGIRALPATAQVAAQQGKYLARLAESGALTAAVERGGGGGGAPSTSSPSPSTTTTTPPPPPFRYGHKGSLAYVGQDRAVMDLPVGPPIVGWGAGAAWKSYETFAQISLRNAVLVAGDWVRTKIFGRDISRF